MNPIDKQKTIAIITLLLSHFPDSIHEDSNRWKRCWNKLNLDEQNTVKDVRKKAYKFLLELTKVE